MNLTTFFGVDPTFFDLPVPIVSAALGAVSGLMVGVAALPVTHFFTRSRDREGRREQEAATLRAEKREPVVSAMTTLLVAAHRLLAEGNRLRASDAERAQLLSDAQLAYGNARAGLLRALPKEDRSLLADLWQDEIVGRYEELVELKSGTDQERESCRKDLESAVSYLEDWVTESHAELDRSGKLASLVLKTSPRA